MPDRWSKRDEEFALCIAFLKLGARVASDIRAAQTKGMPPEADGEPS